VLHESLVEVITAGFDRGRPAVGFGKVRELIEKVCSPECRADALDKVLEQARRKKVVPAAWGTDVRQLLGL
jgi:hypothetical protein